MFIHDKKLFLLYGVLVKFHTFNNIAFKNKSACTFDGLSKFLSPRQNRGAVKGCPHGICAAARPRSLRGAAR